MKHIPFIILLLIITTSCATMFNSPYKTVTIYTSATTDIIHNEKTIKTLSDKVRLSTERKKDPLTIVTINRGETDTIDIKAKNSFWYWANIMYNGGIGMIIERNEPKRYTYPRKVYLNPSGTVRGYSRYPEINNMGSLYLRASLPHINSFLLKPVNEGTKINTGFWGFSTGFDYYHSEKQFINLGASAVTDIFVPFPAAVHIEGEHESMYSIYISLSNNHRINRFSLGYGLSWAKNNWNFRDHGIHDTEDPPTREAIERSHYSLGLIFPAYIQFGEYFYFGVVYRPSFYRPTLPEKFKYEHLISFDIGWKIKLKTFR